MLFAGQAREDQIDRSMSPDSPCEQEAVLSSTALDAGRNIAPLTAPIRAYPLFLAGSGVETNDAWNDPVTTLPCSGYEARGVEDGGLRRKAVGGLSVLTGSQPPQSAEAQAMNDHACPPVGAALRASSRL